MPGQCGALLPRRPAGASKARNASPHPKLRPPPFFSSIALPCAEETKTTCLHAIMGRGEGEIFPPPPPLSPAHGSPGCPGDGTRNGGRSSMAKNKVGRRRESPPTGEEALPSPTPSSPAGRTGRVGEVWGGIQPLGTMESPVLPNCRSFPPQRGGGHRFLQPFPKPIIPSRAS